jgi:predicted RNase H-like HicB family nuclease
MNPQIIALIVLTIWTLAGRHLIAYVWHMNVRLVVEPDQTTGRWSAVFPEIPGCASAGDTEEEAIANAREALALWFEPVALDLPAGARVLDVALT